MISFCTVVKGRWWQLKQTLQDNLRSLDSIDAEWVIVDYNCPDGSYYRLGENSDVFNRIVSGKVRLYRLADQHPFSIPTAKNLAHMLGSGELLFNLDCDEFIDNAPEQLLALKDHEILACNNVREHCGRLGYRATDFIKLGGYDEALYGAAVHDIDLLRRAKRMGYRMRYAKPSLKKRIENTHGDTAKFLDNTWDHYVKVNERLSNSHILEERYVANPNGMMKHRVVSWPN